MSVGLLVARLILGLGLAAYGSQKLFGWFGGYGIKGTGGFLESIGFRPGPVFATLAGLSEMVGGLLLVLGFLGPVGPALILMMMVVAIGAMHIKNGFFNDKQGCEHSLLYVAGALALTFGGFGKYSLDSIAGTGYLFNSERDWIILAVGVIIGLINLGLRRPLPVAANTQHA